MGTKRKRSAADPMQLANKARQASGGRRIPPVEDWNPPFCGDMDLVIRRDGSWHYCNSPIGRKAMVELFSTILRHDEDGQYYLVTPVEKCGIQVEDAPFIATEVRIEGEGDQQRLHFVTNVGDEVTAGPEHPIRVELDADGEPRPYVHVRGRLEALIHRNVFYRLVELLDEQSRDGEAWLGLWSSGAFYPVDRLPAA